MLELFSGNSTKSAIISILSEGNSLSAKVIHSRLKKEFSKNISYQAVYKFLIELESKKVLIKEDKKYLLNGAWIENIKKSFNVLSQKHSNKNYFIPKNFDGSIKFHFDNYSKFCVVMAEILESKVLVDDGKALGCIVLAHAWWPFKVNFNDFVLFGKMIAKTGEGWAIIKNDFPLDKFVGNMYLKGGLKHVIIGNNDFDFEEDLAVQGNTIIKISFSTETKKIIDKIYLKNKNIADLFSYFLLKKEPKVNINVEFTKDPILAKIFRKQIQEKFKSDSND